MAWATGAELPLRLLRAEADRVYGIAAEFPTVSALYHAAEHIRDAGFKPVQRDTLYRTMFLN